MSDLEMSVAPVLKRVDQSCERIGDLINPILVKETRQALKSRQFVVTFSLILFAALAWTIGGSLSLMPQIYTVPSAQRMMTGYYAVLALPMLLVVPLAAYRSLESEIDDGTLELLSISTLTPWQIVLGKLGSASLQMLLYFITLFPCLAYAYTLRGVDLPSTLLLVGILALVGILLTVIGLFFAPLARARTGRIASLLALIFLLVSAEYGVGSLSIGMIWYGNPLPPATIIFAVFASIAIAMALGHLLLTATAAQLTPETENRSTSLRLSMLAFTAVVVVTMTLALLILQVNGIPVYVSGTIIIALLWTVGGSMIVGESATMTPRIRRELPNSFFARVLLTWITPGPTTGLVFVVLVTWILLAMQQYSLNWLLTQSYVFGTLRFELRRFLLEPGVLLPAYLICYWVCVRLVMAVLRRNNNPRVEVGFAALVVVAVLAALIPYSLELHFNDYQPLTYHPRWQMTNWLFTISTSFERGLSKGVVSNIVGAAVGFTVVAIVAAWQTTQPRRIATPERVEQELGRS
ncbi:MAG: ABC transporter permease [Planctomycetota bacterium]